MCFPNQINMYIADHEIPWEYVWIEFDGLRAKETIELTGLSVDQPVYKARYKDLADLMKSEMLYIVNHKEESPFHLIGHLYLFLDSLVRSCSLTKLNSGNGLRDFYIREAVTFIEQNFQNTISVEDSSRLICAPYQRMIVGIAPALGSGDQLAWRRSRRLAHM